MKMSPLLNKFLEKLQSAISQKIDEASGIDIGRLRTILAVDSAYRNDELMVTVGVLWDLEKNQATGQSYIISRPTYEYVPGLLFMREAPSIVELVEKIDSGWDLLMVDGHGLLHPRKAGLAVMVGITVDKPTIGIAKKLLVGEEVGEGYMGPVYLNGQLLGYWFKDRSRFYASPGYKVSIEDIPVIVNLLGGRYPEAMKLADRLARKKIKEINC